MFIYSKLPLKRSRDEEGVLLLSTVVISLFIFAVILIVAGSGLTMVQAERTTKSFMQSDNAAMHGVQMVRKQLAAGSCSATGNVPVNPSASGANEWNRFIGYSWSIHSSTRAQGDYTNPPKLGDSDVTSTATCPTPITTWVILKVVGTDNFGKRREVAYTYSYHPTTAGTKPRFPYAFVSAGGSINSGRILTSDSPTTIKASLGRLGTPRDNTIGSFSCGGVGSGGDPASQTNFTINGDVVVQNSGASLSNCSIGGSANIDGRVIVARSSTSRQIVAGDLCAARDIVDVYPGNIGGLQRPRTDVCPSSNSSEDMWRDYNPGTAAISGWSRVNVPSTSCPNGTAARDAKFTNYITAFVNPTVLNASACGSVFRWGMGNTITTSVALKTNVTIISPSFEMGYITIASWPTTATRSLGLVTPDTVGNNGGKLERPNCTSAQTDWTILASSFRTTSPANVFMYTPCGINFSGTATGTATSPAVRGQIYTGGTSTLPNLRYVPIQLPGATPTTLTNPTDGLIPLYPSKVVEG